MKDFRIAAVQMNSALGRNGENLADAAGTAAALPAI